MQENTLPIEMLLRARDGDRDAFGQVLETYRADLWGYLVNHVKSREEAEDLFQEICLKAMNHMHSLREPDRFRSWLFSIAMNAVRSSYRQKKNAPLSEDESAPAELERALKRPAADVEMVKKERLDMLRGCILKLPDRDREILLLDVMADLPQQEIADRMALNLNTVKTILRRARIKLARMMVEVSHG